MSQNKRTNLYNKERCSFTEWSPTVPVTMPAENMTLEAQWTINQYTITYDSAGGSEVDSITTKVSVRGDILKNLKDNDFKISIKEEKIEYRIDATNLAIENIAQTMNIPVDNLQNIQIEITINKLPSDQSQQRIEQAKTLGHEILFAPVQFEITARTI